MPKTKTIALDSDAFGTISAERWVKSGTVTSVGGRARIETTAAYPNLLSKASYRLANKIVAVEVPTLPATHFSLQAELVFFVDANNFLAITFTKGSAKLGFEEKQAGKATTIEGVTFDPVAMKWWRIRTDEAKVYFETSPDGAAWTTRREITAQIDLTKSAKVKLMAGYFGGPTEGELTVKYAEFDSFSISEVEPIVSTLHEKAAVGVLRKWLRIGAVAHQLHTAGPALGSLRIQIATALNTPITRPDDIFVAQWWQIGRIAEAKALGSTVLIYLNSTRAHAADSEGRHSTGLTLAEAEAIGAATAQIDGDAGNICMPNHGPYAQIWLERAIAFAEAAGAQGVFLDDMNVYSDGATEALTEAQWKAQMQAFNERVGTGLAEAGLLAIPNMSGATGQRAYESAGWLEAQFAFYDGGFDEMFTTWPNGELQGPTYIEEAMKVMARQTRQGKLYLFGVNGSEAQIRYAIALALLQQQYPGKALVFASPPGPDYSRQEWTPDLQRALALGVAIDGAKRSARSYSKGSVSASVANSSGVITSA